ncbi:MAG TPA: hypothetical protein VK469_18535 [Candidatus Kapabacteria bacterium]|nr:hypothetical protein [Candidatus Kapabacteria bacterium]
MKKKESITEPVISKHDQEFKDFFNAREVASGKQFLPGVPCKLNILRRP